VGDHLFFFATDVHGSEVCFRKWLNAGAVYGASVVIMGGDLTGKVVVPVHRINGSYRARWRDQDVVLTSDDELTAFCRQVADAGAYTWRADPDEAAATFADEAATDALFDRLTAERMAEWVELADSRISSGTRAYIIAGNDDAPGIDDILRRGQRLQFADNRTVMVDDWLPMVSLGDSTPTPWDSPRELSEEEYAARLEALLSSLDDPRRAVVNLHVPPHGSTLDDAPALDEHRAVRYSIAGDTKMQPVGSLAVREAIERHQPVLALHGHIHEARGTHRLGKTLCINPGSSYEQGQLLGAVIDIEGKKKVKNFVLTSG
jgi:Icc-related predicted phosphoesterase